jgi:hypothetical protein
MLEEALLAIYFGPSLRLSIGVDHLTEVTCLVDPSRVDPSRIDPLRCVEETQTPLSSHPEKRAVGLVSPYRMTPSIQNDTCCW